MDTIIIEDLAVLYRVGVTEQEQNRPQRLLVTVEMRHDFAAASSSDNLSQTIDYSAVCQFLLKYGAGRSWKLLEKLASEIAGDVLSRYGANSVVVQIKKFVIPEARYVGVRVERARQEKRGARRKARLEPEHKSKGQRK